MYRLNLKTADMSIVASRPPCTNVLYQNGGLHCGGEMETKPVPTQRRYTLHDGFYDVLVEVGAKKDQPYEWKDVIMLFIRYLAKRKPSLLDPNNKSRVICGDDPLGRVFGVPYFTKEQTKLLVRQHVSLVEDDLLYASLPQLPPITGPCPPPGMEPVKRGSADEAADDPDSKRSRSEAAVAAVAGAGPGPSGAPASPTCVAAPPFPAAQLHRMDTIEAADGGVGVGGVGGATPGTAAHVDEEEAVSCDEADDHRKTYAREMEPVECTDASDSDCSSGVSDVDSPLQLTLLAVWADDVGMMADMETSESDSEHRDTWACAAADCQHANTARKSRCDRCWRMRPSWVVGPRRKKRRHRDQARHNSLLSRSSAGSVGSFGPVGSVGSQGSQGDSSVGSESSQETAAPSPQPPAADQSCIICCERPRDAAIIHGRTGCQVTCYGCARRLWKRRDLCPSCRRTIEKIVFMRFG